MSGYVDAWHFLREDRRLQFGGDRRVVTAGTVLHTDKPIQLCERGFHGSIKLLDALRYAPGSVLCRTRHSGEIIHGEDKLVSSTREVLWMVDAEEMLRQFACLQALSVSHLWNMPEVVRRYLQTQDPDLRAAAEAAASAAAQDAAWAAAGGAAQAAWVAAWAPRDAARDAAWAARATVEDAAWATAQDAAEAAAWAAAGGAAWAAAGGAAQAAWVAAEAAAWDVAWDAANAQLERMAWMLCGLDTAQFPTGAN